MRATAYCELTGLVAQKLLTISGQGRGTRYALIFIDFQVKNRFS